MTGALSKLSPTMVIVIGIVVAVVIGAAIFFLWKKVGSGHKEMDLAKASLADIRTQMDKMQTAIEKRDDKIGEQGQKIVELEKANTILQHQLERTMKPRVNINPPSRRQGCDDDSCSAPVPVKKTQTRMRDIDDIE